MPLSPVRDSLVALQQAQHKREMDLKDTERARATRVLIKHAEAHDWPPGDLEEVMGALGLGETTLSN
jgi:hypothetical protein